MDDGDPTGPASVEEDLQPAGEKFRWPEHELVRPLEVVAVSAQLDEVAGRDICVLSIERYPQGFFLHLGGSGALEGLVPPTTRRVLGGRCTAGDDRGGRYEGRVKGAHSGFPWTIHAQFVPALDPSAGSITLRFPNPFDTGTIRTSFSLPDR